MRRVFFVFSFLPAMLVALTIFWAYPAQTAPLKSGDPAGGDLTGTYPNPTIKNLAVTGGKIGAAAVTAAKLGTSNGLGSSGQVLTTDGIGGMSWSAVPSVSADSLDWSEIKDNTTLDATTSIELNSNGLEIGNGVGTNTFSGLKVGGDGNVGIGTASPGETLEVKGQIRTSGNTPTIDTGCIAGGTTIVGTDVAGILHIPDSPYGNCLIHFTKHNGDPNEHRQIACVVSTDSASTLPLRVLVDESAGTVEFRRSGLFQDGGFMQDENISYHCFFL